MATIPAPTRRRLTWVLLFLGFVGASIGCNPATLALLVYPWVDDKVPPRFKLADPDKEVSVAVVAWFGGLEVRPEVIPADAELGKVITLQLRERFAQNKEKVKLIPAEQVRSNQNRISGGGVWSPADVGGKVKADFVVALEVNNLSLYEKNSFNQLYRGNAEIAVKVYDTRKPEGEQVVYEDFYRTEYPRSQPVDAGATSVMQFRTLFLSKIGRDIAKLFTAYPQDQRLDMD